MKRSSIAIILCLTLGCTGSPRAETSTVRDVERSVAEFFDGVEQGEWAVVRDLVTDDFLLIEQGHRMDFDDLRAMIEDVGYSELELNATNLRTRVEGAIAYTHYDNFVEFVANGESGRTHLIESAVMRFEDGRWKFALAHVTEAED